MYNDTQVLKVLDKILQNKEFTSHMPYEFTEEGMLQRMNAYIEHQTGVSSRSRRQNGRHIQPFLLSWELMANPVKMLAGSKD